MSGMCRPSRTEIQGILDDFIPLLTPAPRAPRPTSPRCSAPRAPSTARGVTPLLESPVVNAGSGPPAGQGRAAARAPGRSSRAPKTPWRSSTPSRGPGRRLTWSWASRAGRRCGSATLASRRSCHGRGLPRRSRSPTTAATGGGLRSTTASPKQREAIGARMRRSAAPPGSSPMTAQVIAGQGTCGLEIARASQGPRGARLDCRARMLRSAAGLTAELRHRPRAEARDTRSTPSSRSTSTTPAARSRRASASPTRGRASSSATPSWRDKGE